MHGFANPTYPSQFLFSALPCVALYCVRGGVKVVSGVHGSRVAGSFALDTRVGIGASPTDCIMSPHCRYFCTFVSVTRCADRDLSPLVTVAPSRATRRRRRAPRFVDSYRGRPTLRDTGEGRGVVAGDGHADTVASLDPHRCGIELELKLCHFTLHQGLGACLDGRRA